ncbi:hypothetical protein PAAG_06531 [Paracoccidioides lutzii Pb01]|uniref:Uncharacterized protein n=1 Tax=Paracoccidioides lutzii (strain ATCC MYA-826 / Pb01) TaxID=502779 RepID=C1H6Z0_PARBA|nr:hypothetical protein PAAG_06531 [Paracoccidioides lutzii Pb01]EEH35484.1 hypothetical protein PAAG_06531 [Paracoccidioides lutzii Pb01]
MWTNELTIRKSLRDDRPGFTNDELRDPNGFSHIGDDGVLRSFNGDGEVISYERLDKEQLSNLASWYPEPEHRDHLHDVWKDANSSTVSMEQIWNPPKELLPVVLKQPQLRRRAGVTKKREAPNGLNHSDGENINCLILSCYSDGECIVWGCRNCRHYDEFFSGYCLP